jgi:hypothetical protein
MQTCFRALLLLLVCTSHAASQPPAYTFFPEHLLFRPLFAHHEETRLGLLQELGSTRMALGVGGTLDAVVRVSGSDTLSWGPDLSVYALSNEIRGVLFKIGAADGYFGMHLSFTSGSRWSFRFRAMHQSAHQVDGNYDPDTGAWIGERAPFNFTRNYGEIDAAYDAPLPPFCLRLYAGVSASVWNRPRALRPVTTCNGAELILPGTPLLYAAWDITITGIPSYVASNTVEAGVKLGRAEGRGVRIYVNYFNGLDTFGAFYDARKECVSAGFTFDLW